MAGGAILSVIGVTALKDKDEDLEQNIEHGLDNDQPSYVPDGFIHVPDDISEVYQKLTLQQNELMRLYNQIQNGLNELRDEESRVIQDVIRNYHKLQRETSLEREKLHDEELDQFKKQLEDEYMESVDTVRQSLKTRILDFFDGHEAELSSLVKDTHVYTGDVSHRITHIYNLIKFYDEKSKRQAQLSTLVSRFLLLEQRIREHPTLPFQLYLDYFNEIAKSVPSIHQSVQHLPKNIAAEGVPTIEDLRAEFEKTSAKGRSISLAGRDPGFFDYALGYLKQKLSFNLNDNEQIIILTNAKYHMEKDQLKLCIEELEKLEGKPREIMTPWIKKAHTRVLIQDSLNTISKDISSSLQELASQEPPTFEQTLKSFVTK